MTIDTHKHVAFVIEDAVGSKIKSSYKAQSKYAENAGYTTAATLEDAILALFTGFSQTVGDSATALNDSNIRQAIAYLDVANAPQENRAFFLHPNVNKLRQLAVMLFRKLRKFGETLFETIPSQALFGKV